MSPTINSVHLNSTLITRMAPQITIARVQEIVEEAIDNAMGQAVPTISVAVRDQLLEILEERLSHFVENFPAVREGGGARGFQNRDFTDCKPPNFEGGTDPIKSMRWIADVEAAFLTSRCPEDRKVTLAMNLLKDGARDWWSVITGQMQAADIAAMTWEQFETQFRAEFIPRVEVERISQEYQNLKQTTETIPEMNKRFIELARFCPEYAATEEMKIGRYMSMLRDDIKEFVSASSHATLAGLMEAARRRELYITGKRKEAPTLAAPVSSYKHQKKYDDRSILGVIYLCLYEFI